MSASDPGAYAQFRFRVKWDGRYVAGIHRVTPLERHTDVVVHRSGGDPLVAHRSPGQTRFEPVVLMRGLTRDLEFERWAGKVWTFGASAGQEVSLRDFRKDVDLECFDEADRPLLAYRLYRCWVSDYQALPDLDAGANAVRIESLTLQHEGWERVALGEPETARAPSRAARAPARRRRRRDA